MAEQNLLTMVQNILSRLSSDEVNSISDTTESMQVATIIQNKYYDITARGDLPEHDELFQLTASGTPTAPVLMYVPSGVSRMVWLKYFDSNVLDNTQTGQYGAYAHDLNVDIVSSVAWLSTSSSSVTIGTGNQTFTLAASGLPITVGSGAIATSGTSNMFGTVVSYVGTTLVINVTNTVGSGTFTSWVLQNSTSNSIPGYKYVTILPIEQFLELTNRFNPSDSNTQSFVFTENGQNFTFYYKNNHQPMYCTVLSNYYVIFDQFDNTQDTTLQSAKTLAFGQIVPPFTLSDTFVPDLDDQQFPLLLNEATALAFYELRQMPHAMAAQEIKRQWSAVQKNKAISNKPAAFDQFANMGRVPRTGGYGVYPVYSWMRGRE